MYMCLCSYFSILYEKEFMSNIFEYIIDALL